MFCKWPIKVNRRLMKFNTDSPIHFPGLTMVYRDVNRNHSPEGSFLFHANGPWF